MTTRTGSERAEKIAFSLESWNVFFSFATIYIFSFHSISDANLGEKIAKSITYTETK